MELIEKQRRIAVLKKIDSWDKVRCARCASNDHGNQHDATKCTCKAAVEIRKLGVEYEEGSKLRRQGRVAELLKSFTDFPLSVDTYDMLKELEVEDKTIMRNLVISNAEFREWKADVGRAKRPIQESTARQKEREEYVKWRKIAESRGILASTFASRVRGCGYSLEDAAKPGRVERVHNRSLWLDIAKNNGINSKTFHSRKRLGWSEEAAATTPVGEKVGAR